MRCIRHQVANRVKGRGRVGHPASQTVLRRAGALSRRTFQTVIGKGLLKLVSELSGLCSVLYAKFHEGGGVWATQFDVAGILYVTCSLVLLIAALTYSWTACLVTVLS